MSNSRPNCAGCAANSEPAPASDAPGLPCQGDAMTNKGYTTEIVYPFTDDMAMDDGEYQVPIYMDVVNSFDVLFSKVPRARVNGNTFLYFAEGDPLRRVAPDCYVLFGLSPEGEASIKRHNTYLVWEVGKPPDFVLEIGSPSTASRDMGEKRDIYAMMGVPEYWRYDGTGGDFYDEPLLGERLVDGEYEPLEMHHESDGSVWAHSDALNLDLWWMDGDLRYWDPVKEEWLRTPEESEEALRAAEARAAAERDARLVEAVRADAERDARLSAEALAASERDARLAAEARNAQLEAELRRLRGA